MKVLLCLCACIAVSSAGIIGYPLAPLGYHNYIISHPIPTYNTFARPLGVSYTGVHGFPVLGPSYFDVIPGNVVFPGVPGVVHYLPVVPADGKGKDKKKPESKDEKKDDKDTKEETTEEPKKDEDAPKSDSEDLAH